MKPPDILRFLHLQDFLKHWVAAHPEQTETRLFRWMGERVGLSREQVRNLVYQDEHPMQMDAVPAFARLFGLDDLRREYLRALVRQASAGPDDIAAARLAVWEMHASATGVPADVVAGLLEDHTEPMDSEAAMVALLPLIHAHTDLRKPAHIAEILLGGPDAAIIGRASEAQAAGLQLGQPGHRGVELPQSCGPEDWETLCWRGLLAMARRALLRPASPGRHFRVIIGSGDEACERQIHRAQERLGRAVSRLLQEHPQRRPTHLFALLYPTTIIGKLSAPVYGTRHPEAGRSEHRLPAGEEALSEKLSAVSSVGASAPPAVVHPPGRPCIYDHLHFGPFAQEMISWRKAHRRQATARWFAKKLGVSVSYANSLLTGRSRLLAAWAPAMARVLELDVDEATYLDGMARFDEAVDPEERARTRLALIEFAANKGVRTMEGESFRVTAHWGASAILALADMRGFRPNPGLLTRALEGRIPWQDARTLVGALLTTGMLVPGEHGPPRPATSERRAWTKEPDLAAYAFHESAMRLLGSELRLPSPAHRFRGHLLALPEESLPRLERARDACLDEVREALRASDRRAAEGGPGPDRVLLFTEQQFDLSHDLRTVFPRR